jgi:hypothetical protein
MSAYTIAGHELEVIAGDGVYVCGPDETATVEDLSTAVPKLAALLAEGVAALAERAATEAIEIEA